MRANLTVFAVIFVAHLQPASAYEGAATLPKGARNFSVRTGAYTGLSERFVSDGSLMSLGDVNSITLDSQTLLTLDPEARALINTLNQFGGYGMGDSLNLGTIRVEANPTISYVAPIFAKGITNEWTLGIGIPLVRFNNDLRVIQTSSSNAAVIGLEYASLPSPELQEGLERVRQMNLVNNLHSQLQAKGYRPLESRDTTFLGDIHLVSIYKAHEVDHWTGAFKTVVVLPTGPSDDPDDLADLGNFHQAALGFHWLEDLKINNSWKLGGRVGYHWVLPDHIEKRVPESSGQLLIPAERKEVLSRNVGDTLTAEINARVGITEMIELATGYERGFKNRDSYMGTRGYEYSLLERNTETQFERIKIGFEFSTVRNFLRTREGVPFTINYGFGDSLSGTNVERNMNHEVQVNFYF